MRLRVLGLRAGVLGLRCVLPLCRGSGLVVFLHWDGLAVVLVRGWEVGVGGARTGGAVFVPGEDEEDGGEGPG